MRLVQPGLNWIRLDQIGLNMYRWSSSLESISAAEEITASLISWQLKLLPLMCHSWCHSPVTTPTCCNRRKTLSLSKSNQAHLAVRKTGPVRMKGVCPQTQQETHHTKNCQQVGAELHQDQIIPQPFSLNSGHDSFFSIHIWHKKTSSVNKSFYF